MDGFALFFGGILGITTGIGLALLICGKLLNKSNNFGDSKGTLTTFSPHGIQGRNFRDRVSRKVPLDDITNPRIIENDRAVAIASGRAQPPVDINTEINNANVNGIQWHK